MTKNKKINKYEIMEIVNILSGSLYIKLMDGQGKYRKEWMSIEGREFPGYFKEISRCASKTLGVS